MTTPGRPLRLTVFFTAGVSLAQWRANGLLDRELALYRALRTHGVETSFVTYGGREDREEARSLDGEFTVLRNTFNLPRHLYVKLLPWLHHRRLARADLFKANQTDGSEVAHRCARIHRKPWVARSGYDWSDFLRRSLPPQAWETGYAVRVEAEAARHAAAWIFSTAAQKDRMEALHPELARRAQVIPNYVDTRRFSPAPAEKEFDVLFVGRLEAQKNPGLLLRAAAAVPGLRLAVAGAGALEEEIKALARELGVGVRWLGSRPHAELPSWMNRSRVYVLCSEYEGLPKTLIEAMSCGMAVVATSVPGVREVVRDGETGLLCAPEPVALAAAIRRLLADEPLALRLGDGARREAASVYALDAVARREAAVLRAAARGNAA
ncbi:MAG: glycosyltransferase family 4 protein [Kiritimatiellia bacterium]